MIIPSKENIEKIFRLYNNQCAFHDCPKKIIDTENHVNGNIFFIRSNREGHPRHNSKVTNQEMSDYTNLIMFCDLHGWEVEKEPEIYDSSKLQAKLEGDLKNLPDGNFELSDTMYEKFLQHFLHYHDPDKFAHMQTYLPLYDDAAGGYFDLFDTITCRDNYIKPSKHMSKGTFELIDRSRKIEPDDVLLFYPKGKTIDQGTPADIEVKSSIRIEGKVPELPKGDYLISLCSADGKKSKFEEDLIFTIL